ncbi:MAG: hypothetical protein JWN45_2963 [Acidobacteriaceae bacterium]|nr:hypothetical protein [Acidobacteriaceae bacterium]
MNATARLILATLLFAIAIALTINSAVAHSFTPPLLSEHSRPAVKVPEQPVAIVADGKTFHDPKCTFLHGKPEMVSAQEAVRKGYAPCVRCMRQALSK